MQGGRGSARFSGASDFNWYGLWPPLMMEPGTRVAMGDCEAPRRVVPRRWLASREPASRAAWGLAGANPTGKGRVVAL